jgi:hypothetical protein
VFSAEQQAELSQLAYDIKPPLLTSLLFTFNPTSFDFSPQVPRVQP